MATLNEFILEFKIKVRTTLHSTTITLSEDILSYYHTIILHTISGDFNFWLVAGQRVKFSFVVNFFTFFFIFTLGCLQGLEEKRYAAQEHKWFSSKI